MALTYSEVTPKERKSFGAVFAVTNEITLDSSYVENGYTLELSKLGLPDEELFFGACAGAFKSSNKTLFPVRITIAGKLQVFKGGSAVSEPLVEVASAASLAEYKCQVLVIGR